MEKTEDIQSMLPKTLNVRCKCCGNHCPLTVDIFPDGRRLISGNHCSRPVSGKKAYETKDYNGLEYKGRLLSRYMENKDGKGKRGTMGLPMVLSMYEYLPFYHKVLTELGYKVIVSPSLEYDNKDSSSTCIPAKLLSFHVDYLRKMECDKIFLPYMSTYLDREIAYRACPYISYYPGILEEGHDDIITGNIPLDRKKNATRALCGVFELPKKEVKDAVEKGFDELKKYRKKLSKIGASIVGRAFEENSRLIVISGRAYCQDPYLFRNLDKLLVSLGARVVTDEMLGKLIPTTLDNSFDQWLEHQRIHDGARFVEGGRNIGLLLLKTSSCGLDVVLESDVKDVLKERCPDLAILDLEEMTSLEDMFPILQKLVKGE